MNKNENENKNNLNFYYYYYYYSYYYYYIRARVPMRCVIISVVPYMVLSVSSLTRCMHSNTLTAPKMGIAMKDPLIKVPKYCQKNARNL